jgi:hypothetical protein
MSYPKGSRSRLIASRQLVSGELINNMNDALYSYQLLTAAGVAQTDAALIDGANVEIAAGSVNNAGAKLVPAVVGATIAILNNSANTTLIYPNGTDQIQNAGTGYAGASTAVAMATLVCWYLRCVKAGFWQRVITS